MLNSFTTPSGDRIVLCGDAGDFLLGPQGESLLRRMADDDRTAHFREEQSRAEAAAEVAAEMHDAA